MSLAAVPGLQAVADRYDGFILDLWGCVHNGVAPYPAAVPAMRALIDAGKRVVLLSNAPRRIDAVAAQIGRIGVPEDAYHAIMSSGEEAWRHLNARPDPWYRSLGNRCLFMGRTDDHAMLVDIGADRVEDIEAADFILMVGPYERPDTVATYAGLLERALERGVKAVCANPDLVVMRGDTMELCAGGIASHYAEMGGDVRFHGKPYPSVYAECLELLGVREPGRILCIGDSLATDIAGANRAGIDSLLLTGGIHVEELTGTGGAPDVALVAAAADRAEAWPTYVCDVLRWS